MVVKIYIARYPDRWIDWITRGLDVWIDRMLTS